MSGLGGRKTSKPRGQAPNREEEKESSATRKNVFGKNAHPKNDYSQAAKDRKDARQEAEEQWTRPKGYWTNLKAAGRAWQKDVKPNPKEKLEPIKKKGGVEDDNEKIEIPGEGGRVVGNDRDDNDDRTKGTSKTTKTKSAGKGVKKQGEKIKGDEQGDDTEAIRAGGTPPICQKSPSPPKMEVIGGGTGELGTNIRIKKPNRTVPTSADQSGFEVNQQVNDGYEALLNSNPNDGLGLVDEQPAPRKPPTGRDSSNPRRRIFRPRDSGEATQVAQDAQRKAAKKEEKTVDPVLNPRNRPDDPDANNPADQAIRQSTSAIARNAARDPESDDEEPFIASQSSIKLSPRLQEIADESQDDPTIQNLIRFLTREATIPEEEEKEASGEQPGDEKAREKKAADKAKEKERRAKSDAEARERSKEEPKVLSFIDALNQLPGRDDDRRLHPSLLNYAMDELFPQPGEQQQDEPDLIDPMISMYRRAMARRARQQGEDPDDILSSDDEIESEQEDEDEPPAAPVISPIDKPRKPKPPKIEEPHSELDLDTPHFPMDPIPDNIQLNPAIFDNTVTEAYQSANLDPVDVDEMAGYMRPRVRRLMRNMGNNVDGYIGMFELSETLDYRDLLDVRQTPNGDRTIFAFRLRGNLAFIVNAPSGQGEWDCRVLDLRSGNMIQPDQLQKLVDGETRLRIGMLYTGMLLLHAAEQPENEGEQK